MLEVLRNELGPALIITRREVRDQLRDWRIVFPIVILTIFFPGLMNFIAGQLMDFVEQYGAPLIGDRLIPFLLMIVGFFPISVSLVIALESFVGEKERRSIEPLLNSPLSDSQLYVGKLLAALVPPLLGSLLGIVVYLVGVYRQVGWQPPLALLIQILLLTTVQALVMVSSAVVISAQTTSVRAANLLASFIIIPMALLIQGESVVMFWANYSVLWWVILGLMVISGLLIRAGVSHFNREELLGREVDTLNLRASWRTFWGGFLAGARNPLDWYRRLLAFTRQQLLLPAGLILVVLIASLGVGASQARFFPLPAQFLTFDHLDKGFVENLSALQFLSPAGIGLVWYHNLRAIVLATVLGLFSFAVLGLLALMLPLMLVGYLMANVAVAGMSPVAFLSGLVLPHGMLEIPALMLAGAAILRTGAALASPAEGRSISEAVLAALGDWARVMLGLVLPLLLGAAAVEVLVTPRVALLIFGG